MEIPFERFPQALEEALRVSEYAGLVALNRIAFKGRAVAIKSFKDTFIERNKWHEAKIRYEKATLETMTAEVYSESPEMRLQEEGGTKSGGGDFRVPIAAYEVLGLDEKKVIPKSKRAKQIVGRRVNGVMPYVATSKDGVHGVWAKTESGTRLLYALSPEVAFDPMPWFYEPLGEFIESALPEEYDAAWEEQMEKVASSGFSLGSALGGIGG